MKYCTKLWGGAALHTAPLRTIVVENAIYMPFSDSVWFENQHDWGIFTEYGQIIEQSVFYRGVESYTPSQARSLDLSEIAAIDAPFDEMVYGGPIIPHYGHFMLSSLARLYAQDGRLPVLFHSHPTIFEHGLSFIREIVSAANWKHANCFSSMQPLRVRRLHIPEPAVVEQERVALKLRASVFSLGEAFNPTRDFDGMACYLSKSKLTGGIAGLQDEEVVEDVFARAGFKIIYPETLSLRDQISLFKGARIVAGTVSSAFHTLMLAPDSGSRRIIFSYGDAVNSNFHLIDQIADGRSSYMSMSGGIEPATRLGFLSYYRAQNIRKTALEMCDVATDLAAL